MGCPCSKESDANKLSEDTGNVQENIYRDDVTIENLSGDHVQIQVLDPQAFNSSLIRQRQQAIDNRRYRTAIDSWKPKSHQQLAETIKSFSKRKSLVDRYWIIFYWITCNIGYDTVSYFSGKFDDQSAEGVFRTRKGVCSGYANLYKYLCDQLQIPCEIVSGYSKGYGFEYRQNLPSKTDHAWNAVQIDGHWYLMESTWGAGHLTKQKTYQRKLSTYYFLPRPNQMIYDHLPEKDRWQLLQTPINNTQFRQMPKVYPSYFELSLQLVSPCNQPHVDFLPGKPYAEVLIQAPDNVILSCNTEYNHVRVENGSLAQFDQDKNLWQLLFAPEQTGLHELIVYAKRDDDAESSLGAVVKFNLDVIDLRQPMKFPLTYFAFQRKKCRIYTPLDGRLKKESVIPIHFFIPGARNVNLAVDSKQLESEGYADSILRQEITVGSREVTIYARYGEKSEYDGLVEYSVQ